MPTSRGSGSPNSLSPPLNESQIPASRRSCFDEVDGRPCVCNEFRPAEETGRSCFCGHEASLHKFPRRSAEKAPASPLQKPPKDLVFSDEWHVRVSFLPSADLKTPYQRLSIPYRRLESKELILFLKIPGTDARSFNKTVSDVFANVLQGKAWMPLSRSWDASGQIKLSKLSPSQLHQDHDLQFLIENCIIQSQQSNKTWELYIAPLIGVTSWNFIQSLPTRDEELDQCWDFDPDLDNKAHLEPEPAENKSIDKTIPNHIEEVPKFPPRLSTDVPINTSELMFGEMGLPPEHLRYDDKGNYLCPYEKCPRYRVSFLKKNRDHFLQHLSIAHDQSLTDGLTQEIVSQSSTEQSLPIRSGSRPAISCPDTGSMSEAFSDSLQCERDVSSTVEIGPPSESSDSDYKAIDLVRHRASNIILSVVQKHTKSLARCMVAEFINQTQATRSMWTEATGTGGSGKTGSGSTSANSQVTQSGSSPKRKRAKVNSQSANGPDNNEDTDEDGHPRHSVTNCGRKKRRFACPYFQHDPAKYADKRTCAGPGFHDAHRVKEHLFRRHLLNGYQCWRCLEVFQEEDALRQHYRQDSQCLLRNESADGSDGITREKELQLRNLGRRRRRQNPDSSEEQKWIELYKILFPGEKENIPSAYYDYGALTAAAKSPVFPAADFESFLQSELPPLLQQELHQLVLKEVEDELFNISDSIRQRVGDKIVAILKQLQLILFRQYRKSQKNLEDQQKPEISSSRSKGDQFSATIELAGSTADPSCSMADQDRLEALTWFPNDVIEDINWSQLIQEAESDLDIGTMRHNIFEL